MRDWFRRNWVIVVALIVLAIATPVTLMHLYYRYDVVGQVWAKLHDLQSTNTDVRRGAARGLQFGDMRDYPEARHALLKAARSDSDAGVRQNAIQALYARYPRDSEIIRTIDAALAEDADPIVRGAAARILVSHGVSGVLARALKDPVPSVKVEAIHGLYRPQGLWLNLNRVGPGSKGRFKPGDEPLAHAPELLSALADESPEVRRAGAGAVAKLTIWGDFWSPELGPALEAAACDSDPKVREVARETLKRLGRPFPEPGRG